MGGFGFSYVDLEIEDVGVETFSMDLSFTFAYYVARSFSLGVYLGVPYTESRPKGGTADDAVKSVGLDLALAPGVAFAVSSRTFFYINGLLGMALYSEDSGLVETKGVTSAMAQTPRKSPVSVRAVERAMPVSSLRVFNRRARSTSLGADSSGFFPAWGV